MGVNETTKTTWTKHLVIDVSGYLHFMTEQQTVTGDQNVMLGLQSLVFIISEMV